MLMWLNNISPSSRGAVLLVFGISIFGFSDNLTLLVSDHVGVGRFRSSRRLHVQGRALAAQSEESGYAV